MLLMKESNGQFRALSADSFHRIDQMYSPSSFTTSSLDDMNLSTDTVLYSEIHDHLYYCIPFPLLSMV